MNYKIQVKKIENVTHDVLHLITDKPEGYTFTPGQATELAIDKDGLRDEKRPFTFTSLPEDNELEFTIKMYPSHEGVTDELANLNVGDTFLMGDAWGAIKYQGEGTFIAGGAGITPFIAILKDLNRKNKLRGHQLIFANKTEKDIIYQQHIEAWLGSDFHNILSEEKTDKHAHGRIDKDFLQKHHLATAKKVYLCGPPPMMKALQSDLYALGLSREQLIAEDLA
ncbi:flavodoxin reductase [Cellulophaga sp. Hel_I_12]|uniref:flavodoxin reductase n=1 Tax=Cellulophaga sp. Hel_I_12 TaxID=1249972 RepID=UPI00064588E1|nr:flavodoxin reductase [Cellulophaga sp. Hel_I_12]